jgi:hypothetical protein
MFALVTTRKKILKMANAMKDKANIGNVFLQLSEFPLSGKWDGKMEQECVLHTDLWFDELLNYPVPLDKIFHHRCQLIDYTITINTTTY